MASQGYGSSEVERIYRRARELCGLVEATPQLLPVLYGLWAYYIIRAEFPTALQLAEETLRLAQHQPDPDAFIAYRMLGSLSYYLEEIVSARSHIQAWICFVLGGINDGTGLDIGQPGTSTGGDYTDTPGSEHLAGHRSRIVAALIGWACSPRRMELRDRPGKGLRR